MVAKKVKVTYIDNSSLTETEIDSTVKSIFGENSKVTIEPIINDYINNIRFGIAGLITADQMRLYFDNDIHVYHKDLPMLRNKLISKMTAILDDIIISNEKELS